MLKIKHISDDIIEVKEITMSATKTIYRYFYYDIVNWKRYYCRPCSKPMTIELIKSNPAPDKKCHEVEDMHEADIDWVKKWYLPKI